jgi:hypothetical protein
MFLYIELWKAKDAWLKLGLDERRAKLDELRRAAAENPIPGVLAFSFRQVGDTFLFDGLTPQPTVVDDAVTRPTGYRYAAAWMIPTRELIKTFEQRVENLGWWFDYFEQKNAWGEINPQATLAALIGGPPRTPSSGQTPQTRFGRARHVVGKLRRDVDELKRDVSVVVDYVKTTQSKS